MPNKTVYLTYDEATRLVDGCKDKEGNIKKDFFDWYLIEGKFFAETGVLIIDNLPTPKERIAVSFDLTNPDITRFVYYRYIDQKEICAFNFKRQENLTMSDVDVEVKRFDYEAFKDSKTVWTAPDIKERISTMARELGKEEAKRRRQKMKKRSTQMLLELGMKSAYTEINKGNCRALIYFTYALMFNASKQEPEEITTFFREQDEQGEERVKAIYKYSGYVNLMENKAYRPLIKKDPDEPTREYQRHIQKWTVRGHYRRTAKGLIWIGEHEKGEGDIEARVYGTQNESEVPVLYKFFDVLRRKRKAQTSEKQPAKQRVFYRFLEKASAFFSNFFNIRFHNE